MQPPNQSLTVVHVASGDLWAGAEVQLFHLARHLNALPDLRLHVVVLNPGPLADRLAAAGVEVSVLDEARLGAVAILRRLRALFGTLRPDVVHTHRQKENVLGAFAAALSGVPSLRTVHGAEEFRLGPFQLIKRAYRALDWLAGRFLQARVVAVTPALAGALARRFPGDKVVVVENGVDVDEVRAQARRPVTLPGPEPEARVAFVGRLVPVKRLDLFLEAAARVEKERPGAARFFVFGDGPERDRVAARRAELGLEGAVELMGFVAELPPWLARMDLLLICSDHEGLPMNLLEALVLGVPVVAHAVGGISEVLADGEAGTLVHGHSAEAYAGAVRAFLDDPAPFRARAQAGAARVADRYGAAGTAARYRELYGTLAGERRAGARAVPLAGSGR